MAMEKKKFLIVNIGSASKKYAFYEDGRRMLFAHFEHEGEKILLLGDKEPTEFRPIELAYFDKLGGYNIDFNYRDARRTMVTEKTTDLWINVDGVYDITPEKVQKSLHESVERIIKYCGGKVEMEGVII